MSLIKPKLKYPTSLCWFDDIAQCYQITKKALKNVTLLKFICIAIFIVQGDELYNKPPLSYV